MKDIDELSLGRVKLSTGTLYEALARLLDQNLIERIDETESGEREFQKRQNHPGRPRKSYRLMQMGWRVLEAETNRMRALVAAAPLRFGGEQV